MTVLSRIYYMTGEFHAKRKGHQLYHSEIFYPWDTNSLNIIFYDNIVILKQVKKIAYNLFHEKLYKVVFTLEKN